MRSSKTIQVTRHFAHNNNHISHT